jgi:hypothetical protein
VSAGPSRVHAGVADRLARQPEVTGDVAAVGILEVAVPAVPLVVHGDETAAGAAGERGLRGTNNN